MEEHTEDDNIEYIDAMKALRDLNDAVGGKELLHGWKSTIKEFKYRWKICNKKFRLSITPKIHIIFDHLEDQLNITIQVKRFLRLKNSSQELFSCQKG